MITRGVPKSKSAHINNDVKFSSGKYGVAASPRVTTSKKVRKGGGRRQIGKPYKIRGKWYTPKEDFGYNRKGQASWYGPNFHGRLTANGEVYDQYALTAAHPTFPLPSYARVTNLANGKSLVVRVNDRGPYHSKRIIDLSARASKLLDYQSKGVANVQVQYIKQAPLHGLDHKFLIASYRTKKQNTPVDAAIEHSIDYKSGRLRRVDTFPTGSVPGSKSTANSGKIKLADPFLAELKAIKAKKDTGSTLSLRMHNHLIVPK